MRTAGGERRAETVPCASSVIRRATRQAVGEGEGEGEGEAGVSEKETLSEPSVTVPFRSHPSACTG